MEIKFIVTGMEAGKDVELLRSRLTGVVDSCVKAVVMFGSRARGESEERSDVDLLVLHEGCGIRDPVLRRRHLYNCLKEAVGECVEDITVIDMELERFLKPMEVTALLLNIYWDAVVVYDRTGTLRDFLKHVRGKIVKSGLKRVKDGKAYRWTLPKPMMEIKIL
jgi:predicted nucleotidyltransferase